MVEHDEETIRAADYVLDMGPGAGIHGGHICAQGTPTQIEQSTTSITGQYLGGKETIVVPQTRRAAQEFITLKNSSCNNLQNIDVDFPTQVLCGISGVSGSGKSTLMNQTLMPALKMKLKKTQERVGKFESLTIPKTIQDIIIINQEPIGRTPRSNPATYTKMFDDIRALFGATNESKARGYKQGRFSFNVPGGRCEACQGDGLIKIEMNFLPDVYVECEDCLGQRYNKDTLEITYKGKNIAQVLQMSVEDAHKFFNNHRNIHRKLQTLYDVGLGYIKLGQSATTLSGGESQRIKLTRELAKFKRGKSAYLLDEPTTGLHFEDIRKLIVVLNRLVDKGNSIFVIEHNLDVLKCCDYIIDLGPDGGEAGGQIVARGTPEEIAQAKKSYTAPFLRKVLPDLKVKVKVKEGLKHKKNYHKYMEDEVK